MLVRLQSERQSARGSLTAGVPAGTQDPHARGPFLQADAPAGPTPGGAPDALAPESPTPREAGVCSPHFRVSKLRLREERPVPAHASNSAWTAAHPAAPPKVHRGVRAPHSGSLARPTPFLFQVPQESVTIFVSGTRAEPESSLPCVVSESRD